jgi:hypothetical protein
MRKTKRGSNGLNAGGRGWIGKGWSAAKSTQMTVRPEGANYQ